MKRRPIAITAGDPAGIGPDLLAALPAALPDLPLVLLADRDVLTARAAALGLEPASAARAGRISCLRRAGATSVATRAAGGSSAATPIRIRE